MAVIAGILLVFCVVCRLTVKNMLQHKRFTIAELSTEIEELVYQAMLRGMQSGLGYGWNLGQKKLLEDQKKWGALK